LVILHAVKTAISLPDQTFARVELAAARLGVSRSEFFARAAERWLRELDDAQTTAAIDRALDTVEQDASFVANAASRIAATSEW
jgi:metal-responsive CopG/Arc/MetJ family transcriptional regulator